jgi:hypothetical protein
MGEIVKLSDARETRRSGADGADVQRQDAAWTEEALVESWSHHVRRVWRPRRGIKRGCLKRIMRTAYRTSGQGADWLAPCPLDLIVVALPDPFGEDNVQAATYLTMLLFDYLWRIDAISAADKEFAFEWCYRAQTHLLQLLETEGE